MDKIAIISDIYGNLEALEAVLEDIQKQNIYTIYCLRDVIGYGPNPVECLERIFQYCQVVLMGDREYAVINGAYVNHTLVNINQWMRSQLKPRWLSLSKKRKLWQKLNLLPSSYREDNYLFVHASPRDPMHEYLLPQHTRDLFGEIPQTIKENFAEIDRVAFVGHTSTPGIITEESKWYNIGDFNGIWKCIPEQKIICNVGSVGMMLRPIMGNKLPCYIIFSDNEIRYHRVNYNYSKTCAKIKKISHIDNNVIYKLSESNVEHGKNKDKVVWQIKWEKEIDSILYPYLYNFAHWWEIDLRLENDKSVDNAIGTIFCISDKLQVERLHEILYKIKSCIVNCSKLDQPIQKEKIPVQIEIPDFLKNVLNTCQKGQIRIDETLVVNELEEWASLAYVLSYCI